MQHNFSNSVEPNPDSGDNSVFHYITQYASSYDVIQVNNKMFSLPLYIS